MQKRRAQLAIFTVFSLLTGGLLMSGSLGAQEKETALDDFFVLSLGDGEHFVAASKSKYAPVYYGTKDQMEPLRVLGGGGETKKGKVVKRDHTFWAPNIDSRYAGIELREGKWTLRCGSRHTEMKPVEAKGMKTVVRANTFNYKPHSLGRDSRGRYYYVDRLRGSKGSAGFRVFVGQKGQMKQRKLTNVVADSEGEVYSTKRGELRLVVGDGETQHKWIRGKKHKKLVTVPVGSNRYLIYNELGVYEGQQFGTPCDFY